MRNKELIETTAALRKKILANGYTPIRNRDKRTFMKDWPRATITEEVIDRWARKHSRDVATGVRIENGLAAIDIDIDDENVIADIANRILEIAPILADDRWPLLIRRGGGFKQAWFVRTDEMFKRIHTRGWRAPDGNAGDKVQRVEIFGGANARQFGVYGPHTLDEKTGKATVFYRWNDAGPMTTPMQELPILTKTQFFAIANAAEQVLEAAGWTPAKATRLGEGKARRVYDLTEDMVFQCLDGADRTLAEAKEWARSTDSGRCSASWLEGFSAANRTRCMLSVTRGKYLCVHDFSTSISHIEAAGQPRDIIAELAHFAKLHRAGSDRERA